jgi:hypothetical protein
MSPSDQLEELLGQYWDAAWLEGKGESTCIDPNLVLYKIRALFNATAQRDFDDEYPWQDRSYETLNEYIGTTYHGRIKSRDGLQTIETSCPALTKFLLGALNADTYVTAHRESGEADGCNPLWGVVTQTKDGLWYRCDFCAPDDTPEEMYADTQEMLREMGWEIKESEIEHDCISGVLVRYNATRTDSFGGGDGCREGGSV